MWFSPLRVYQGGPHNPRFQLTALRLLHSLRATGEAQIVGGIVAKGERIR